MKVDAALRDKPWRRDMPACVDDTSRAVARANESFVTHSVSLPLNFLIDNSSSHSLHWELTVW